MMMTEKINSMNKTKKTVRGKKGFTLVELVIVIAILAILSAIVVPLIKTTIGAAKMSVMESDCETVDMLVKEAITNAESLNRTTTYGAGNVTAALATVGDVCYTNNIDTANDFYSRSFDSETYTMVWDGGSVTLVSGTPAAGAVILSDATAISALM